MLIGIGARKGQTNKEQIVYYLFIYIKLCLEILEYLISFSLAIHSINNLFETIWPLKSIFIDVFNIILWIR